MFYDHCLVQCSYLMSEKIRRYGLPNITETLEAEVSPLPIQQPPCSLGQAREGVSVNSGLSSGQKNLRGISSGIFLPRTSWTL